MSAFDKFQYQEDLEANGWVEIEDGFFKPPEDLWSNKQSEFSLSEALDLQQLLGCE